MARLNSFYLAPALWREPFSIEGEEFHHASRVLRAKAGDTLRLFDGQGRWGIFIIEELSKKNARLRRVSEQTESAPSRPLILAVGWSKGLRRGFLLEKAVELGAAEVWFWQAARSQGDVPEEGKEGWERQLVSAAKQCGACRLPCIRTFRGPAEVIHAAAGLGSRVLCWEREENAFIDPALLADAQGSIAVLGPEGGLEDREADLFREHGFTPVGLGPRILRFETAAVLVLSLHLWAAQKAPQAF
ncbi:MAG: 16S rRNA (uracil(1498)-N(3))-methyltransferase [Desulfomicrobium sp.]